MATKSNRSNKSDEAKAKSAARNAPRDSKQFQNKSNVHNGASRSQSGQQSR